MTCKQYHEALRRLNLRPYGQETQAVLGLSRRQLARLAAGDQDVPKPIAMLLNMYLAHGIPEKPAQRQLGGRARTEQDV
jgi:hypothetical protein